MKTHTRQRFNALLHGLAKGYGVEDVSRQFTIEPTIQQRLQDKIVEQSTFLPKINVITVDELSGENILGSASGPVSGRTDTSKDGKERTPRDVLGLASYSTSFTRPTATSSCATRRWTPGRSSRTCPNATPVTYRPALPTTAS